jgi:hypothetical protein
MADLTADDHLKLLEGQILFKQAKVTQLKVRTERIEGIVIENYHLQK